MKKIIFILSTLFVLMSCPEVTEVTEVVVVTEVEKCATPTVSPDGGGFISSETVTLSCSTSGSTIYYTLDGSAPTNSSNQYNSALTISSEVTIKAIAYKEGLETSNVVSKDFTNLSPEMAQINTVGVSFVVGLTSQADLDDGDSYGDQSITYTNSFTNNILIGKYEVTQSEYDALMKIPGSVIDSSTYSSSYGLGDNYPAYYVTWYEAVRYCNELSEAEGLTPYYTIATNGTTITIPTILATGYRLPTEAEWEYCAKGGDYESNGRPTYTYSGSNTLNDVAWNSSNSGSTTHEVGTLDTNGFGLYDMSGNMYEWCYDWYGNYTSSDKENYAGVSSGSYRVRRGSYWGNSVSGYFRSVERGGYGPSNDNSDIGFRVCRYL